MNRRQIDAIRRFWKPKGRRNQASEARLREIFSELGIRERRSISAVLYHPKHAPHHAKIINNLRKK